MSTPKELLNSESTLLSLGKWAIFSVKIPGYFPLSLKPTSRTPLQFQISKFESSRHLTMAFSYCSLSAAYTLTLLLVLSAWDLLFFGRQSSFNKYLKARGPTEIYAYTLMLAISSVLGIYITLSGLRKAPKFLQYWKDTCHIFDKVQVQLGFNVGAYQGKGVSDDPQEVWITTTVERFHRIEKSIRNSFLALVIPISLHVLIDYGYRIADSLFLHRDHDHHKDVGNGTVDVEDIELAVGLGVWTFFALCGSGISIWMMFFIQFYTACLLAIGDGLGGLSGNNSTSKATTTISPDSQIMSRKRKSFVDVDEIFSFSRVILHPPPTPSSSFRTSPHPIRLSSDANNIESNLERILSLFQSLLGGIDHFNEFFGTVLIFEMGVCVLNLLVYLFFALVWLGRGEYGLLLEAVVPTYVYGKELYDMGSVSEELTASAEKVVKAFGQDVPLAGISPHMHLKLQILATQVSINPPVVSAKQFFVINRGLVTAVLSGLATFLVVLVQFRDADAT